MTDPTNPTPPGKPSPGLWTIVFAQLFFGLFSVAIGGWLTAEPELTLARKGDGTLACDYALHAYGRIPAITRHLDDLVDYRVTTSRSLSRPNRAAANTQGATHESSNIQLIGSDGRSFSLGNAFDLSAIRRMIDQPEEGKVIRSKVEAGTARIASGYSLAAFGILLWLGALWNLLRRLAGISDVNGNEL